MLLLNGYIILKAIIDKGTDLSEFFSLILVCKMCVFVSPPMKIVTFLVKNADTAKRVVDFPLARDTFRNKIMEIVEDFACESKFLHFSFFFHHVSPFFRFFSHFFIFSIFSFFSFFHFFILFHFLSFSVIFSHFLSFSFMFFFIFFFFFFFFSLSFSFCRELKFRFFSSISLRFLYTLLIKKQFFGRSREVPL